MLWTIDQLSSTPLHEQIAAVARRALADGELIAGERLPTARELGGALDVDPNTVLRAYRSLREEGVLQFRRGRGVRVSPEAAEHAPIRHAVRELLDMGRRLGYSAHDLTELIKEMT